jgi:site-specific DNA-methyltransferase (adenine-specific)
MSAPYYQDEWVTLYHGDCREITDWLGADVLVTDPPYGYNATLDYGRGGKYGHSAWCTRKTTSGLIAGDDDLSTRDVVIEMWGDRPALVFGNWKTPPIAGTHMVLIWDKGLAAGMGDLSVPWKPNHESVFVAGRGFIGSRDSAILTGNVVTWASKGRVHPNMKPTGLMAKLLDKCPPGTIADPFVGSGSTLVAAKTAGRRSIGVEIEERYCEVTAKRLSQDVLDFEAAS